MKPSNMSQKPENGDTSKQYVAERDKPQGPRVDPNLIFEREKAIEENMHLKLKLAQAERDAKRTEQWYATRWQRLRDLFKGTDLETPACSIMANGTASPEEVPSYQTTVSVLTHERDAVLERASELESKLNEALKTSTAQIAQVAEEKGKLENENAKLRAEIEALKQAFDELHTSAREALAERDRYKAALEFYAQFKDGKGRVAREALTTNQDSHTTKENGGKVAEISHAHGNEGNDGANNGKK